LPDLFKNGVPVQKLAAIRLCDAAPEFGSRLFERGLPGLLAFL